MKLIIVRHGETLANINKIIQGQLPGELSPNGRLQAGLLAERLKTEPISHIWSSPLARAYETAREIAAFHKIVVDTLPELKERRFGTLEGESFEAYFHALEESGQPFFSFHPPGGESLQGLEERIRPLINKLKVLPPGATILIIAHGIINKIILKVLLEKSFDDWQQIRQDNTCVNILNTNRQTGKLESALLNCTSHLSEPEGPGSQPLKNQNGIHYANLSGLSPVPGPPDH
ncbi:MAG: histidine phosphatase family protein [Deltaproteobacteria bacterium]|nr:histidine phosphatase family protein [Deltaproteobacteria bacterium]